MTDKKTHVLYPVLRQKYPSVVKAEGLYLYDSQGRRYIDSAGGPICCSLGHGLAEMAEVLQEQARRVSFVYRFEFTTPELEEAAARINEISGGMAERLFFVSSGSEATEMAVKLARKYHLETGKPTKSRVIARWLSYHGMTAGALSWSGMYRRRADYLPYLHDASHIPPVYFYRCWFNSKTVEECDRACAQALETEILCHGPENVAAFIAEPISGMSLCGAHPGDLYFKLIREICDRYDVLLILDEVMTGVGRTGKWFGYEHFGITPDLMALAKGLSGGYFPVGAVALSPKVVEGLGRGSGEFWPGHTWAGNPMAAAVTSRAIGYLQEHDLVARCAEMGDYLKERLQALRAHPTVGDIRGKGLMVGLEFVKDKTTKEPLDPKLKFYDRINQACLRRGMYIESSGGCERGRAGDMVMFGPPFIVTREQIDEMVDILDQAIAEEEKKIGL